MISTSVHKLPEFKINRNLNQSVARDTVLEIMGQLGSDVIQKTIVCRVDTHPTLPIYQCRYIDRNDHTITIKVQAKPDSNKHAETVTSRVTINPLGPAVKEGCLPEERGFLGGSVFIKRRRRFGEREWYFLDEQIEVYFFESIKGTEEVFVTKVKVTKNRKGRVIRELSTRQFRTQDEFNRVRTKLRELKFRPAEEVQKISFSGELIAALYEVPEHSITAKGLSLIGKAGEDN